MYPSVVEVLPLSPAVWCRQKGRESWRSRARHYMYAEDVDGAQLRKERDNREDVGWREVKSIGFVRKKLHVG